MGFQDLALGELGELVGAGIQEYSVASGSSLRQKCSNWMRVGKE